MGSLVADQTGIFAVIIPHPPFDRRTQIRHGVVCLMERLLKMLQNSQIAFLDQIREVNTMRDPEIALVQSRRPILDIAGKSPHEQFLTSLYVPRPNSI